MKNKYFFISLLVIAFTSCENKEENNYTSKKAYELPDSLAKSIKIDTVKKMPFVNANTFTGKVTYNDENVVKIFPLVSGSVQEAYHLLGDYVTKGQVLATIKSSEMAGINSDLINAQSNLMLAKKNYETQEEFFKSGLSNQLDVLNAKSNYEQAKGQLEKVNRILSVNTSNKNGDYLIKSPINGFIVEKNITNNTMVRPDNSNNLYTISDLKNVWIIANVYESNINNVKLGDQVLITTLSYPDKIYKGKVDKILNVLDPVNKVMKVRIVVNNDNLLLKPEMFANIQIVDKEGTNELCISPSSLIFDQSKYYVIKYNSKKDLKITPVEVKNTLGDKIYIKSGINEGDKIIGSEALLIYNAINN